MIKFFLCALFGFFICNHFNYSLAAAAAAAAKSLQSCPTLCDPIDGSPPGSPVPGIFQARTLEWVAISFSNAWKWKVKVKSFSCVWLFTTPWTAAHQAPPSIRFSRQEYQSGVPPPSPEFTCYLTTDNMFLLISLPHATGQGTKTLALKKKLLHVQKSLLKT